MFKIKKFYRSLSGRLLVLNLLPFIPIFLILSGSGAVILQIAKLQSSYRYTVWLSAYIISLVIALSLLFLQQFFFRKRIIEPIITIREASLELANGDPDVRISSMHNSPEEFIELADTFNFMVNHIEERNSKLMKVYSSLAEKESMFRLISHNVPGIVYLLSAKDNSVLFINDRILQNTGYHPEQFLTGEKNLFDLIIEEDRERVVGEVTSSAKAGIRFQTRFQIRLATGELRFYETFGTSFRTLKREQVIEGFANDITEKINYEMNLQQSLSEKEMLIKEVHHRVKNNLAMISSLIHLQQESSRSGPLRNGLDDLDRRIRSIALIHEKLYQSDDLSIINFRAYLEELTSQLQFGLSASQKELIIHIVVEGIVLPVDRCIPLGLIINELITNAYKHSQPENSRVEVTITMDYLEGNFILSLRDNGAGLPDDFSPYERRTLGFQLIEALSGQLSGSMRWFNAGGACFELTFPENEDFL